MTEIVSIHIVRKKKGPAESCGRARVVTNFGIEGDYRSGRYQTGQITLVEAEVLEMVSRKLDRAVPAGASRRQVMVRGIPMNELVGQRLRMGAVLVQVEDMCKPCDNMETSIGYGAKEAMDGRGGIRCRIIEGGEICVNDKVTVESPACPYCAKISNLQFKFMSYLIRLLIKK